MTSMNMPTPIRMPMTGAAVRMAAGTAWSTLIFLPVNRPDTALSMNMRGMPMSSPSFSTLKTTIRTTSTTRGM